MIDYKELKEQLGDFEYFLSIYINNNDMLDLLPDRFKRAGKLLRKTEYAASKNKIELAEGILFNTKGEHMRILAMLYLSSLRNIEIDGIKETIYVPSKKTIKKVINFFIKKKENITVEAIKLFLSANCFPYIPEKRFEEKLKEVIREEWPEIFTKVFEVRTLFDYV